MFRTEEKGKMESDEAKTNSEQVQVHVMCLSFLPQGHVNPMIQFCQRLASKSVTVTLIIPSSSTATFTPEETKSIKLERISDGSKEEDTTPSNVVQMFKSFKVNVSQSLAELLEKQMNSNHPPKFLIYDSYMPWALDIARRFGIDGGPLCTTSMAVHAIYYHVFQGALKGINESSVTLPSMPVLEKSDFPPFLYLSGHPFEFLLNESVQQWSNIDQLNWVFVNTFHKLEEEVLTWMESQFNGVVKTIGPLIPPEKSRNDVCLKWLDSKRTGSVVYVSFGSWAPLEKEQAEEFALGLQRSDCYFLWVVKDSEKKNIPEVEEKGLVVNWSPQLEVLAHKAVGCFMTHCGWNSTLEALRFGVPIVAMPQFSDQPTNAKFITDVWEVGIRAKVDEKGIVRKEEVERCVRLIMETEQGDEIRKNSEKWKEFAYQALSCGGSSEINIGEFVSKLSS